MKTNNKVIALLGAVLILLAAACGERSEASSSEDDNDNAAVTVVTTPPAANQADLKKLCKDFEDDSSYLKQLPGPTPGAAGASFTSSEVKADVIGSTVAGIVTDFVATPVAGAHWGEIDRGAILGSTDPHSQANSAAEAQKLRQDDQTRQKACENLALELSNAFADDTVVMNLTPSLAEARRITQLAFWVYDPEYKTSGWICGQAIPPAGIKLVGWKRSFSEGGSPLGEAVLIAYERRELVAFDCPGEAFTGSQVGPEEEAAVAPETSIPAPESSAPLAEESKDTSTNDDNSSSADDSDTASDDSSDDSSSDNGDTETPVTAPSGSDGGKGDTGSGSGGSGDGGGKDTGCGGSCGTDNGGTCTTDCGGTCTTDCGGGGTTTTVAPTTTVPVTTPTTTVPVTTPTTTMPSTTTTAPPAKDPAPTCFPWLPPGTPGACD